MIVLYDFETPKKQEGFWWPADSNEDNLDATAIFGGVMGNIITKNFKGGTVTAILATAELPSVLNENGIGVHGLDFMSVC